VLRVSWLVHYDPDDLVKWHHFAFLADLGRVRELRGALQEWTTWRDRGPLEHFVAEHLVAWHQRRVREPATRVDEGALSVLVENAAVAGLAVADVRAAIDRARPGMTRALYAQVLEFPARLERLLWLRAQDAPEGIVGHELERLREALLLVVDEGEVTDALAVAKAKEFRQLFETAIELAIVEPWAENSGLGRLDEVVDAAPKPRGVPLVDPVWPVHHENLEGTQPCIYGFDGFEVRVCGLDAEGRAHSADDAEALAAFAVDPLVLRRFALDRLAQTLEEEGTWAEPDEAESGDLGGDDGLSNPNDESDFDGTRRRRAMELAPERVVGAVDEVRREWEERHAALLAALRDVAAGRRVLLQWSAKNPIL
jgi:hypothetical protein